MAGTSFEIPDVLRKELEQAAAKGLTELKEHLEQKTKEWTQIPLNIAITGIAGVGKSSFINAICGITADDEEGAHVDVVEATKKTTPYKHPQNQNLVFWDLPGVGTPNCPRNTYLEDVKFETYDFFLIISAGRFREDDLWLAKEIRKLNKKFHFVRTKIDIEIENNRRSHPKNPSKPEEVLDKIRKNCTQNLEMKGLKECKVFLVDNLAPMNFEFPSLADTLIDEFPANKREAFVLSITVLTTKVLEKKIEALNGRIYMVSLLSALAGAIPIPSIGAAVESAILLNEINLYKSELGLDSTAMDKNAQMLKTGVKELERKLCLQSLNMAISAKELLRTISRLAASEDIPTAFPVLGSLLSAGVSYGVSVACLKYLLKFCSDDARKLNEELMKNISQSYTIRISKKYSITSAEQQPLGDKYFGCCLEVLLYRTEQNRGKI